jgi:sugar lactone lactonase YvrE
MKKVLLLTLAAIAAYLFFWPVPIEPVAWQAPPAPALEGPFERNDRLNSFRSLGQGYGRGPEDVAIDDRGRLYVGYEDGRIVRFQPDGSGPELLADTGGRPLGLDFAPDGRLIVADGYRGLLRIDAGGAVTVLAQSAGGIPFGFTDDVDVARDGRIYFSDASSKFGPAMKARDDIMEHGGHGRLLRYDPASGATEVLLDNLQFANGVALARDEDFVLVNETGSYRITRYWLKGDRAGTHDVFLDNLPGIPDGISANGRGTFWVALYSPRNALLDAMSDKPLLRKMAFRLPELLQPQPAHHAFVLGLDQDAAVIYNLQGTGPDAFAPITSAEQHGDTLYLGSLTEPRFAAYSLADAPRAPR